MRTRISYLALVLALPILALALEPQMPLSPTSGACGQNQVSDMAVTCPAATDFQNGPGVRIPPSAPVPVSPEPGSKMTEPIITLVVSAPVGMPLFHYEVFHVDSGVQEPWPTWQTFTRSCYWTLPMMQQPEPGVYRWSCRLYDGYGWSNWFEPWWTFEIEGLPQKGETQGSSFDIGYPSLVVSPNPFGPNGTTIHMTPAGAVRATAEIFDATGRLVCRLGSGSSLFWDGTDETGNKVGAGTYLCCVRTDDSERVVALTKSR
jgi:hypothetical protein